MAKQNGAWRIYWKSFSKEDFSQTEFLLLVVNHANTIPENTNALYEHDVITVILNNEISEILP